MNPPTDAKFLWGTGNGQFLNDVLRQDFHRRPAWRWLTFTGVPHSNMGASRLLLRPGEGKFFMDVS